MKGRKTSGRRAADAGGLRASRWPRLVGDGVVAADAAHEVCVNTWLKRASKDLPQDSLLPLFQAALTTLWDRTKTTLGEVTLAAIAERVVYNASERFPHLAMEVDPTEGILCADVPEQDRAELVEAIRFVLVEFLTVLGNLTAQILSPELHAELSKVALPVTNVESRRS